MGPSHSLAMGHQHLQLLVRATVIIVQWSTYCRLVKGYTPHSGDPTSSLSKKQIGTRPFKISTRSCQLMLQKSERTWSSWFSWGSISYPKFVTTDPPTLANSHTLSKWATNMSNTKCSENMETTFLLLVHLCTWTANPWNSLNPPI